MDSADAVVIGAGVVGLAIARELALAGREVIILEAENAIGTATSSRNSEVIHAGIYYPRGSAKARTCVEGRSLLYRYCAGRGIPHIRCGKLIVATSEAQLGELESIRNKAHANGVTDVVWLSKEDAHAMEPAVSCVGALHSPSTGVVDSHAYMLGLLGDAEAHGAMLAFLSPLQSARVRSDGRIELHVGGAESMHLAARTVVNAAGLTAPSLARRIEGYPADKAPPEFYAKGNYYSLIGKSPFSRLVYPVPEPGGLGVHVTIDLGGQARFGPDVEWIDRIGYDVDPRRADKFYAAIRRYWPQLPDGALAPGYAGIRPKIAGPNDPAPDFLVQGPAEHGVAGLVNLFGIESPGLTASLALARDVARRLH
ncbi:MAG: NAD(P)/FAD-dependent oxidoreductase [Proteobacteria bacterium]|nr:NAD(P)/FAD-dependent oxidoreductase [Pseudomonadota bacterium]